MRVAVAGSGAMARYICDEFPKYGHEVVILSRTIKEEFENRNGISQVVTNYSVSSLTNAILECDVLISIILSYTEEFVHVHLNLIEACHASPQCKRFIPSEYGGDLENYPDLPSTIRRATPFGRSSGSNKRSNGENRPTTQKRNNGCIQSSNSRTSNF